MKHLTENNFQKTVTQGFTLVELLVGMFVITTIGTLIVGIFMVSLRSTSKVNNLQTIRQSGNYTLSQMVKMLQFAQQFDGVSTDGNTYTLTCQTPPSSTNLLQQYRYVRFTSYDRGQTVFSCRNNPNTIASNSASLIDTNTFTVSSCSFTCSQIRPDLPQTIGISFTIQKRNANNLIEDPSPLDFKTSVTIRNLVN